jgi:alpha-L-rhamnosidase
MLSKGATTFWEQWNGFYSQIHSCYTSPGSWFYQGLAGIRPDPDQPAFKKIIIKPAITGDLTWVKATHNSSYGMIESSWKINGNSVEMDVVIPPNTTARIFVPVSNAGSVKESNKNIEDDSAIRFMGYQNGYAEYETGSGKYYFTANTR